METKQWWRRVDSLYDIIAQCARKVDTERIERIRLMSNDDSIMGTNIYVEASPKGFLNGKYDALQISTHTDRIDDEKKKEAILLAAETGKRRNLGFYAEKWQDNETKNFEFNITKGSRLDNLLFGQTLKYEMKTDGEVTKEDIALYKDIALMLGAVIKQNDVNAGRLEIHELVSRPYAFKIMGLETAWDPVMACKLASDRGFDVSVESKKKEKLMHAYFPKLGGVDLRAGLDSGKNLVFGLNMNEADYIYSFFNSVREFGGKEWGVEYSMKPKPAKSVKEPAKPKNAIMTTEMQKEKFIDDVIKSLEPKK